MKIAGLFAGAVLAATTAAAPAWADIFIDFHDAPDKAFYTVFLDSFYQGEQIVPSLPAGPDLGVRFNDFVGVTLSLNSTLITGAFIDDPEIPPEGPPFIVIKGAFKHVSFDYGGVGVGTVDARVGSPVDGQPFAYSGLLTKPTAVDTLNTISFDVTGVGQELDLNFFFTGTNHSLFITNLSLTSADSPTDSVPEPATWALMIGGFGLAGGALRHRRGGPALGR